MKTEERTEIISTLKRSKMKIEDQIVEFVPFGTKDKIKLSVQMVKELIAVKTKSGKSCTDQDAFKFLMMCFAKKLDPFSGDAFLIGYDSQSGPTFSLITAHQAFLKRAEVHPEFDGMESGTIVMRAKETIELIGDWHMPNDQILGGWATVFFKNRSHPMKKKVRLARFNKNYGIWRDDPAGMIVKCAEADALRSSFPTMLGGLYISEELDTTKQNEIARPIFAEIEPDKATVGDQPEKEQKDFPNRKIGEPWADTEQKAAEEQKKKVESSSPTQAQNSASTLTQKLRAKVPSTKKESLHERFAGLLKIGGWTPQQFVDIAHAKGWLDAEEQTFDEITETHVAEFLQKENLDAVMSELDEYRSKGASQRDELL